MVILPKAKSRTYDTTIQPHPLPHCRRTQNSQILQRPHACRAGLHTFRPNLDELIMAAIGLNAEENTVLDFYAQVWTAMRS